MAEVGTLTVKVIPDVSGMEQIIMAELDRISAELGQVNRDELAHALTETGRTTTDSHRDLADSLLQRFVIIRRREPDASIT